MGTVREGTDTAGTPVGEIVEVGTGRVLVGVCGTLAVSSSPPVTSVVVITASVIAWFSAVCGGGTVVWVFIVPNGADVPGASPVDSMLVSATFGELLMRCVSWMRCVSAL